MKTVHAFSIAFVLGIAAALGGVAATHAVTAGNAHAATAPSLSSSFASRKARLDRWQRQLQTALHRRPPKLPKLLHLAPVKAAAPPAPAFVSQPAVVTPRTIYVHATAPPAPPRGHEHESDGAGSEGGGHDD